MAEQVSLSGIRAVVFDKDGTLIDVHRAWGPAMAGALLRVAPSSFSQPAERFGADRIDVDAAALKAAAG